MDNQTQAPEVHRRSWDFRAVAAPFFIVGFQRSGTTMLRMMLNAHPDVAIPHNSGELWPSYWKKDDGGARDAERLTQDLLADARIRAWKVQLDPEDLLADSRPVTLADVMRRFHEAYAVAQGKRAWGDKNTGSLVELDRLNRMFPDCRIIHLVRDGRDCALSHGSAEYVYGYENVLRTATEWREQVTLCHKMGAMLPQNRFLEVRYEDLLGDPEGWLRRISGFLGIEYSERMLSYHADVDRFVPLEKRSLWPLLDRPPMAANAYKWKRNMKAVDRAIFERNAGGLLREFGYETSDTVPRRGRVREFLYEVHSRWAWRFKHWMK